MNDLDLTEAAIREAGWVDPEEAARLQTDLGRERFEHDETKSERDDARKMAERYRRLADGAKPVFAQRDALLPVVEAVRAAALVTGEDVTDWQRGYRACSERVLAAVDALDSGTREESTDE